MLATLDIVIAFVAVIMTVASLLITILVQMVSAALSLRGKNLSNALALTFQTIDPNRGEHAHELAAQILRDPIFSDSLFAPKHRPNLPHTDPEMQALFRAERDLMVARRALATTSANPAQQAEITAAQQVVTTAETAVAQARATIPADRLPAPVEPATNEPWSFLSLKGATTLATAIRPGEIYRLLHEFSAMTPTEATLRGLPVRLTEASGALIRALGVPDQPAQESLEKLQAVADLAKRFASDEEKKAVVDSLANFGSTVERATTQAYDRFQRWFGSAQDRAEQWFQFHVRGITVVLSILTAVFFQLDTVEILQLLQAQPGLVKALVASAPGVLEQGEAVLDPSDTAAYHTYLLWRSKHPLYSLQQLPTPAKQDNYVSALKARLMEDPDTAYPLTEFAKAYDKQSKKPSATPPPEAQTAKAAYLAWAEEFPVYRLEQEPDAEKDSKESVSTKLSARLMEINNKDLGSSDEEKAKARAAWLEDYNALFEDGTMAFEQGRRDTFNKLKSGLAESGFDLIPNRILHRWKGETFPWFGHFWGMVITAALLTLGAPFWFNLLKNLMNLRPAVATLVERRPQSSPALPQVPPSPTPPS